MSSVTVRDGRDVIDDIAGCYLRKNIFYTYVTCLSCIETVVTIDVCFVLSLLLLSSEWEACKQQQL
jgi:hypothetical protein